MLRRRPIIAFVGSAQLHDAQVHQQCLSLGRLAVDSGFRVVSGGLSGVMEAVSQGARSSPSWREGDVMGVVPTYDRASANQWVDIAIPTGMGHGRTPGP